eukprot:3278420-Alexandrium_andersonii.AAC.1
MSASLVGSEMCIRDSLCAVRVGVEEGTKGAAEDGDAPWIEGLESVEDPVSYTHLTLPTICSV